MLLEQIQTNFQAAQRYTSNQKDTAAIRAACVNGNHFRKTIIFVHLCSMRLLYMISAILLSMFLITCGGQSAQKKLLKEKTDTTTTTKNSETNKTTTNKNFNSSVQEIELSGIDTSRFVIDTLVKVADYKIFIAKVKYDAEHKKVTKDDLWFNPITMFVENASGDSIIYSKTFSENQFVTTYTFKNNGRNYITLSESGGGSGFTSTIYKIESTRTFTLKEITKYSELCFYTFDKEGNELLMLQGVWQMFAEGNDDIGETHFADHVYDVFTVDLNNDKITHHGTTRNKYPSEDSGTTPIELFKMIQKKEPKICKNINIDAYAE